MLRKSAALFVAFLCAADATKDQTKTGNKIPKNTTPHDKTNLRKVSGFSLCTMPYEAYVGGPNVAGTGAFSYPVYPGDCDEVMAVGYTGEEIGSLSATCSGNPYEGIYTTIYRVSETAGTLQPVSQVGPCDTAGGCTYPASDSEAPQFQDDGISLNNVIPANATSAQIQAGLDQFCAVAAADFDTTTSQCSAELRLSGNHKTNKHPGSILSFDYTTTTTLEPAGSIYTTDTQYSLGGAAYDIDGVNAGPIYRVELNGYVVVTSLTCLYRPTAIDTDFKKIYGGSGRFEKYAASKVASVEQTTELDSFPVDTPIANPSNAYQTEPQFWMTQLDVNYVKHYLDSSML